MNSADRLWQSSGVDVSNYDDTFLCRSLQKRMAEIQCASIDEYCSVITHNELERAALLDSLHISYSQFFRNPLTFAVLEQILLPTIALKKRTAKRKEIRVWSAACAGGQEAYSLAILLEELRNRSGDQFTYRIFATDQSEAQIAEAQHGWYTSADLHTMSLKRAGEWFTRHGEEWIVSPKLKEQIEFSVFDLFNEELRYPPASIFGDFDLVFCANFLFYYRHEFQKLILSKISSSLASDGVVITGEAERDILMRYNYHEQFPQSAIFKRNTV